MQVEDLSSIEKVDLINQYRIDYGVGMILTDADDTLWKTRPLFATYINQCIDYLAEISPRKTRAVWQKELEDENDRNFELFGVHPDRWLTTMNTLGKINSLSSSEEQGAIDILMKIYNTPPELLPRTVDFLDICQLADIGVRMVTHAEETWTERKLEWTCLNRFFSMESDVFVVEPRGHKTVESWRQAMRYFGVNPANIYVMGDSARADINPVQKLSVRPSNTFLIRNEIDWAVHNEGVDPRTNFIDNPGEMVDFMVRQAGEIYNY